MGKLMVVMLLIPALFCRAEIVDLERVRSLALANSRSLARYDLLTESALLDEKSQRYDNLPSLSLGASASMNLWGDQSLQDSLGAGVSFGVSQKLWDGGKASVLKAINSIAVEITRKDARAEYFAVLDSADTAYYGTLEAAAALDAAVSNLEAAVLALSMAEIRLESGMISYGDYLQALAEKEARETTRNQGKRDLIINTAKLRNITGLEGNPEPLAINFEHYGDLISRISLFSEADIDARGDALWKAALANNPSLAKAALNSRRTEQSVTLANRDYFPSLSASLSTGLNYSWPDRFTAGSGRVTISGNIPLDFWVTGANVEKKRIAQNEAALAYRDTEVSLNIEIRTALLDCVAQADSVLSSRRADEYAQKNYEHNLELYRLSQNSLAALSDAAALAGSSRTQRIRAQYGFLSCLSRLRSLGGISEDSDLRALLLGA
ncbi:MAG: TolC family protein [Spirochaetaceae bacterium]|nr:TolC family protein [Spirochaetaceae bacterium]